MPNQKKCIRDRKFSHANRFCPAQNAKSENYKLLTNLVVPRPIARVSTINLAPFSFFNTIVADPLYIIISVGRRDDSSPPRIPPPISKLTANSQ